MRIWQRMKTSGLAMLLAALLLVMTAIVMYIQRRAGGKNSDLSLM